MSSLKNNHWKHLWLNGHGLLISFIILNLVFSSVVGYMTPRVISGFYQSLGSDEAFMKYVYIMGGLFIAEYINRFLFEVSIHRYIQLLLVSVRKESFSLWLKAPFKNKKNKNNEDYPMGEVLSRLMNDTDAVREVVSSGSVSIFMDIVFILSCLISFLQLNSTFGIALFSAEVVICILLVKGSRMMAGIFMDVRRITGRMARVVTDLTSGLKELFFNPNPKYASKRGDAIFEEFLNKQLHANIWDASYYSAAESLYPILIALVMLLVPYVQITEVAILAVLIDLIQKSISPIKQVASKISVLQRAGTGLQRISEFNFSFDYEKAHSVAYRDLKVDSLNFKLKHFQYDSGFSLKDIHFNLKSGDILGILGESGCGKSTLLKLLSGQYYTFDGLAITPERNLNFDSEKELLEFSYYVSLISQDSHVFSESLKFNITLGDDNGFEEFWNIAIEKIPYLKRWGHKVEDKITSKSLSMGQKQLVSGLRALYLKKPIILMDEISSGLDSELELALRDLLNFFRSRSITIIVTHRLETILNSTQLLLLNEGRVELMGSPSEIQNKPQMQEFLKHL